MEGTPTVSSSPQVLPRDPESDVIQLDRQHYDTASQYSTSAQVPLAPIIHSPLMTRSKKNNMTIPEQLTGDLDQLANFLCPTRQKHNPPTHQLKTLFYNIGSGSEAKRMEIYAQIYDESVDVAILMDIGLTIENSNNYIHHLPSVSIPYHSDS